MNSNLAAIVIGFIPALVVSAVAWPIFYRTLKNGGAVIMNYRGASVVRCSGIVIPIAMTSSLVLLALFSRSAVIEMITAMVVVLTASFLGLVDDLIGSEEAKGFKGHFKSLAEGRLTTGALKALGTGAVTLAVTLSRVSLPVALIDTVIIALSVNMFNLLDLRPARALKLFLVADGALLFIAHPVHAVGLAAGLGAGVSLIAPDLREEAMLGDVGSNALGAIIGVGIAFNGSLYLKLLTLCLLLVVQLYAERYSITELIARIKVLRRIDEWGLVEGREQRQTKDSSCEINESSQ